MNRTPNLKEKKINGPIFKAGLLAVFETAYEEMLAKGYIIQQFNK